MLEIENLQAGYDRLQVLWDVSMHIREGEFVALIGANGAGKTTTLRAIAGLLTPQGGCVRFLGENITGYPAHRICQAGISFITEELNLFQAMSVEENLLLGAYLCRNQNLIKTNLDKVFSFFPILAERRKQLAGTLSGGERRMLALGRGLMSNPRLLVVDEPSLGLAPIIVLTVFKTLQELHAQGVTLLLVEQNVTNTLQITDRAYLLERGKITLAASSKELLENEYLKETYLGKR
ncbi:MAG: ABC transporter ATP-binding protein [Anaerolineales bacterium]|nr:ABC transporter ATP-binding protein [Anaerolineales bacterium]